MTTFPRLKVRLPAALFPLAAVAFVLALTVGGCAIRLAPDYDQAIFEGLTKANEDAMKLFASVSSGPYSKRQPAYNSVIGELNAVQVQIRSRSEPVSPLSLVSVSTTAGKNIAENASQAPTSGSVDTLIKIMQTAQHDDSLGRLTRRTRITGTVSKRIDFLKESFAVQMAQALAYEKALQR